VRSEKYAIPERNGTGQSFGLASGRAVSSGSTFSIGVLNTVTTLDRNLVDRAVTSESPWRAERRLAAFEAYEALDMPDDSDEMWKYIDLDFAIADFSVVTEPSPGAAAPSSLVGALESPVVATIVDGVVTDLGGESADGLLVQSVAQAGADEAMLEQLAASAVDPKTDAFAAAHGAFGTGGLLIHLSRNVTAPVVLVDAFAAQGSGVSFPRVVVATEESAHASVVVHLRSEVGRDALVVPRIEIAAGSGSIVDVSVVQTLDRAARSVGHLKAVVGRDATVTVAEAGIGGALSRWHLMVDLEGRGSNANIVGAYFGDRHQVLDYRYFMHHAGLNTTSNMFLKGAVEDEALSVFTGMIRIDEGAQKTDAYQTNRNLILSEGAAAQSVPNLEILANDVKCGHGSSVGPLDEDQRYYLMSRGLDEERADRLQVRGFFDEAISRFPHPELAASLRTWINTKFVEAQESGRL